MADRLSAFRVALLEWYDSNKRDLPWRASSDTYSVWISETMLQQTTVTAVVPYYERWMERFPTVGSLATASEEGVLTLWQGLGYYRRARNLHRAARTVVAEGWPSTYEGWLALPGVGAYTAGAVCSIALGLETAAVDGNVARVYSRIHACSETDTKKMAHKWAERLAIGERPGDVAQALMELGATVCTPRNPACGRCFARASCKARASGIQESLPIRPRRMAVVKMARSVVVTAWKGKFGVRRIEKGAWWEGMYEFESNEGKLDGPGLVFLGRFSHTVTHHRIEVNAWLRRADTKSPKLEWRTADELAVLPLPAAQRKVLNLAIKAVTGEI